jgi:signal transduction histidine kinase
MRSFFDTSAGFERRGRQTFLFLGFVPVFLTAVLLGVARQNQADATWVDHTREVLTALDETHDLATRSISSARAFFAVRDESWVADFEQLRSRTQQGLQRLRVLVADNPEQQARVDALAASAGAMFGYVQTNIDLVRSGSAMNSIMETRGEEGRTLIAAFDSQVAQLENVENRLLAERKQGRQRTNALFSVLCICVMLVSAVAALRGERMIRRYRDLRDQAEGKLTAANEHLESRVQERTSELTRSNDDLRQFAYAASHDLNEPLRTVGIYSQLLRDRYVSKFDREGTQVLGFIETGVYRMEALLHGLRDYLEIATAPEDHRPLLDLRTAVDAALADLKTSIAECGATVTCGKLPSVRIPLVHARQLFQNLLGNALKYRGDRPPEISIAAEDAGSEWIIEVRDNGIGIEPEYQSQIFELFKRLHTANDIPGSGLGLPICRNIVHRYGGRIWVESERGKGSAFRFTLPREA